MSLVLKVDLAKNAFLTLGEPWLTSATADSSYLKLDASNDPLTGTLDARDVRPSITSTYNLGGGSRLWKDVYLQTLKGAYTVPGDTAPALTVDPSANVLIVHDGAGTKVTTVGAKSFAAAASSAEAGGDVTIDMGGSGNAFLGSCQSFLSPTTSSALVEALGTDSLIVGSSQVGYSCTSCTSVLRASGGPSIALGLATVTNYTGASATLEATGFGSVAMGVAAPFGDSVVSRLSSTNYGTLAVGNVERGVLESTGLGSVSFGYVFAGSNTAAIRASGGGSLAVGMIYDPATGSITASGDGAVAAGHLDSSGSITASGLGALAVGYVSGATSCVASAANTVQFGPGTNSTASSVKFGTTVQVNWGASPANLTFISGGNLVTDTSTGTKIATATTQKLGFFNATPIVQPASSAQAAVATTAATNVTPYGYTTAAQADGIITLLNQIRTVLVNLGLMKGAA